MGARYQVPDSGMLEPNVWRGIYTYIMPGEIKALISFKGDLKVTWLTLQTTRWVYITSIYDQTQRKLLFEEAC